MINEVISSEINFDLVMKWKLNIKHINKFVKCGLIRSSVITNCGILKLRENIRNELN